MVPEFRLGKLASIVCVCAKYQDTIYVCKYNARVSVYINTFCYRAAKEKASAKKKSKVQQAQKVT